MMDHACVVEPPATPQGQGLVQECFELVDLWRCWEKGVPNNEVELDHSATPP